MLSAASIGLAAHIFFQIAGADPGVWPDLLAAAGFQAGQPADVIVVRAGAGSAQQWIERMESGAVLILEGESDVAAALGFTATPARVRVQSVEDVRIPKLRIVWEQAVEIPVFRVPADARVFTRERWEGAPLVAGVERGAGAALWVATDPGARAFDRYPYLVHALRDLGVEPAFQSRRLWAFFDSSYRLRADPDYLARRWRASGIAALHVAAWHYYDPDEGRDAYLRELMAACRRNAIAVYAWLELPHVSERFWDEHPEWREKTAILQDAHLDWRKLMNLASRECFRAVASGVRALLDRFDWDGVNLAELYFESLEGASNPARFTPMNNDVRREFHSAAGFDPIELFAAGRTADPARLRQFLDWRAALAARLQHEWLSELAAVRREKPHLDIVLTHIDDRFDTGMRDALGADAAALLPAMDRLDFTFLIEDPATIWNLGPQRYTEIAKRYAPLTKHAGRLAIDLNIVERYQDVYPTRQQTGTEQLQLVHAASAAFQRVALYFENSILAPDVPLLPAAAAAVSKVEAIGDTLAVTSGHSVRVAWKGPALVDGLPWAAADSDSVLIPAGTHVIGPAESAPDVRLLDLNADIISARSFAGGVEFAYKSSARALAIVDAPVSTIEIDGEAAPADAITWDGKRSVVPLPRGQHIVRLECR
jgi:hypothetical protein